MNPIIKAVILGFIIVFVIILFSPIDTYFLPYFVAPLIVIYAFGLKSEKEGLLVSFAIYMFTEWIIGSISLVGLLLLEETVSLTPDLAMVLNQLLTTAFVLLAGAFGPELARRKPMATTFTPRTVPVPPPPSIMTEQPQTVPIATSEQKKYCRYCGAETKTDAAFCEKCGKKIA